jgi:O-antigen/teichoic acid export membrane protein
VIALWFVIGSLQSMSFPIAIRRKKARIIMYSELIGAFVATLFTITYCYYSRDYWGMIYGILVNQAVTTLISYYIYPEFRPRLHIDRTAAREMLGFTKFTMPSSLLTLAINQFDKVVFLKLFNLQLLGLYGLAGNITGPIESLITKVSQSVLYPRCAHNFRADPSTVTEKYYSENVRLFASILFLPAAVGGAAQFVILILYPLKYQQAGPLLQILMLRAGLLALASPAEDLLIATGEYQVILVSNVFRAIWLVAGSMIGYYLFGFMGFVYGAALSALPPLVYLLWLQAKKGMLVPKYEGYRLAFVGIVAVSAYLTSRLLQTFLPLHFVGK